MSRLGWYSTIVLIIFAAIPVTSPAQNITTGSLTAKLKLVTTVTSGAQGAPTFGVGAPDPRFMVVGEQGGRIRMLDFNQTNPLLGTDFLNIPTALAAIPAASTNRGAMNVGTEKGLLGSAFSPDFYNPGTPGYRKFYTYTNENYIIGGANPSPTPQLFHETEYPGSPTNPTTYDNQIVIREWTATPPDAGGVFRIDTSIEPRAVMRIGKPGQFHNAGAMQFGPDGYLYFSIGDGGAGPSNGGNDGGGPIVQNQGHTDPGNPDTPGGWTGQGNAQDRRNIYGKIIRIKPTTDVDPNTNDPSVVGGGWRVPKTNPFTADSQITNPVPGFQSNWLDEIYAYGFRNPFRIGFDKLTGDLYAADVGQDRNTFAREEVDKIVKGGNYGWVKKSGTELNTNEAAYPIPANSTMIDPIAQYPTTQLGTGGLAVIGGFVYRGNLLPQLQGKYIFGDLDSGSGAGRLLYTDPNDAALAVFDLKIVGSFAKPGVRLHGVAQDGKGELYFLWENGQITKLIPEPTSLAVAFIGTVACLCHRRRRHRLGDGTTRLIRSRKRCSASGLQ